MDSPKKVIIVGDACCGKTSILHVFVNGEFPVDSNTPTIIENTVVEVEHSQKTFKLFLWDTPLGNEDWEHIRTLTYNQADVVVIVCSINNRNSLENVMSNWYPEVRKYCPGVTTLLVANKIDLRSTEEKFRYQEGHDMSKDIGAFAYLECSALRHQGIREIFLTAIKAIERDDSSSCCSLS